MNDKVTPMHYLLVSAYHDKQYRNILMPSNVVGKKIHINKVILPGDVTEEGYDFWGYELESRKKKFLLSCVDKKTQDEINLIDLLPIYPMDLETVGVKGIAYELINKPVPARIPPKQKISFREMIDRLSITKSSNPTHRKILTIFSTMQRMKRANNLICTPPGMGKDSTLEINDYVVGGCGSVTNPTVAKLEFLTSFLKHLAINEVSNAKGGTWDDIQSFLLDVGDMKLKTNKRSRSFKGIDESIILKDLSISLYFNDITEYNNVEKFFDNRADGNVKDRFIPLRLWGEFTEDFNKIVGVNPIKYVEEHYQWYRDIACTFTYFEKEFDNLVKPVVDHRFVGLPKRWVGSLSVLFQGISLYAENDDEENFLRTEVFKAMEDYKEMLKFPKYYEALGMKMRLPKKLYENNSKVDLAIDYLATVAEDEEKHDRVRMAARLKMNYLDKIMLEPTFKARNLLCMIYDSTSKGVDV